MSTAPKPLPIEQKSFYTPPFFRSFGLENRRVLQEHYSSGHAMKVFAHSTGGISLEYGVTSPAPLTPSSSINGYVASTYIGKDFNMTSTSYATSDGGDHFIISPKKYIPPGLKIELHANSVNPCYNFQSFSGGVGIELQTSGATISSTVLSDISNHVADSSISFGTSLSSGDAITIGAKAIASSSDENTQLQSYSAGLQYEAKEWAATLLAPSNLSRLLFSWVQRAGPSTSVAAQYETPVQIPMLSSDPPDDMSTALTVGAAFQYDEATLLKAKYTTGSSIAVFHMEKGVSYPWKGRLGVSAYVGLGKALSLGKFAINTTFGEY